MSLTIPDNILKKADITEDQLLLEISIYLYDLERLSFGQAKTLAQLTHSEFQKELSKRNIYIKYDIDDLHQDLSNLNDVINKKAS